MIEIHGRGYSRALPLIMLSLAVSQPSAETDMPGRRPHRTDGGYVLACRSPELFDAQALEFRPYPGTARLDRVTSFRFAEV